VAELEVENLELYIIFGFAAAKQIARGQAKCNSYMVFFLFAYLMSVFYRPQHHILPDSCKWLCMSLQYSDKLW